MIADFLACLPFAVPLIWIAPALGGDKTREIERAAEAQEWVSMIEASR